MEFVDWVGVGLAIALGMALLPVLFWIIVGILAMAAAAVGAVIDGVIGAFKSN